MKVSSAVENCQCVFQVSTGTLVYLLLYKEITSAAAFVGTGADTVGLGAKPTDFIVNDPFDTFSPTYAVITASPAPVTVTSPFSLTFAIASSEELNLKNATEASAD